MITSRDALAGRPYMTVSDFVDEGYLQEVNRCFLHPLGLALVAAVGTEGMELRVIDARADPAGVVYDADGAQYGATRREAAATISHRWASRGNLRLDECGFMVQPPETL